MVRFKADTSKRPNRDEYNSTLFFDKNYSGYGGWPRDVS